ncbi:Co-chaperone Hsc20 [Poronia punctata]|nr:Co-chaperone Hsc20 [Poronia punctata]
MRRSLLPPAKQVNRLCAFCRRERQQLLLQQQQQQQRSIATSISSTTTTTTRPVRTSNSNIRTSFHASPPIRAFSNNGSSSSASDDSSSSTPKPNQKIPQTHYEFFPKTLPDGPPPKGHFNIDIRALRREFLALQSGAHPDLHPSHMKARAQATSARINEAFRTLENPLSRAQYVLSLRGVDVANDETARVEDPELLMEVLETRERIEEAEEEGDLEGLKRVNEGRIGECVDRLEELFRKDEIEEAKGVVTRLRYWVNVRESIDNWEKGKPVVLEH